MKYQIDYSINISGGIDEMDSSDEGTDFVTAKSEKESIKDWVFNNFDKFIEREKIDKDFHDPDDPYEWYCKRWHIKIKKIAISNKQRPKKYR